jgi:hypothetical protein
MERRSYEQSALLYGDTMSQPFIRKDDESSASHASLLTCFVANQAPTQSPGIVYKQYL